MFFKPTNMLCDPKLILKQKILYEKKIHPLRLVVLNGVRAHTYTHTRISKFSLFYKYFLKLI